MKVLRLLGMTTAFGIVFFVFWRGIDEFPALDFASRRVWPWLGYAVVLYLFSQVFGALAWREVLASHGETLPAGRAESQLLLSQIGKYVPGNMAHLLGRYALGRDDGIPATRMGSAITMEIGVLLTVATLVSVVLLLGIPTFREAVEQDLGGIMLAPFTLITPLAFLAVLTMLQVFLWHSAGRPKIKIRHLIASGLLYLVNFAMLGVSVWCVTQAVAPDTHNLDILTAMAIFTVAWTAGFVMPGAPGGIGIRDGIVALGLGLFVGEGSALAVAVSHRLLSGIGDGFTFLLGLMLRKVARKPENTL